MGNRFASSKQAISICDRCGFRFRLKELRELIVKTKKTNILACKSCWEPDHPQLQLGMYPVDDPQALRNPRPDSTYIQSGSNALGSRVTPFGLPMNTDTNDIVNPNNFDSGWTRNNLWLDPIGIKNWSYDSDNYFPASWGILSGASVTLNAGIAPDGTNRACLITSSASVGSSVRRLSLINTFSLSTLVFAKAGSSQFVSVVVQNNVASIISVLIVDLYNGSYTTAGTITPINIITQHIGNGWYAIAFTMSSGTNASVGIRIIPNQYSVGLVNSVYLWHTQATGIIYTAPQNYNIYPYIANYSQFPDPSVGFGTAVLAPNGTKTAQTIYPALTSGIPYVSQTFTQKTRYLLGVCAKPAGYNIIRIQNADNTVGATFDISVGKISNVVGGANVIPKAVYVGNGFWQCTILCNTIPSSELRIYIGDGITAYTGNGFSGVVLWGAWVSDGEEPYYGTGSDTWWINNTVQGA